MSDTKTVVGMLNELCQNLFRMEDAVRHGGIDFGLKEKALKDARQALLDAVNAPHKKGKT